MSPMRVDLGEMVAHRRLERRGEVLGADVGERRQAVRAGPGLQQGLSFMVSVVISCA